MVTQETGGATGSTPQCGTPVPHDANESTPLLPSDQPQNQSNVDDSTITISSPSSSPVVDVESLDLDLAKVQSIPHGGEVEPGFPPVSRQSSTEHDDDSDGISKPRRGQSAHFIDVSPAKFWTIFSGILFSYLLAFFDSTLMGSIHPVVTSHFHAANSASWLSTAFLLTCTAFQPLFGRISDTFGRRPVYLFSICVFFVTTAWCAMAQSIGSFIAARASCGLGAGALTSLGMIVTTDLVRNEYRGIYQSYINLVYGVGASLGLVFGGFIADTYGWRAAFAIQLPPIFVLFIVAYFTTPSGLGPQLAVTEGWTVRQAINTIDLKGSFLLVVGVTALMLGINLGGNVLSWNHPLVISSLVVFFVVIFLFIKVEAKAKRPVMPLPLLYSAPRANLIFSNFFGNITISTIIFNAPLFFQAVNMESPTKSGLRLLASSGGLMVASVTTGLLITWSRRLKPALVIGAFCFVLGGITTGNYGRNVPGWLAMLFLTPASAGQGFAFPATTIAILAISAHAEQAVITTTLGLFRNLGSVLGVAISSWVLQTSLLLYLNQTVTGVDKLEIIQQVRKSITVIPQLDAVHQSQGKPAPLKYFPPNLRLMNCGIVIEAYERALRLTFLSTILWSSVVFLLLVPVKLPRLGGKK